MRQRGIAAAHADHFFSPRYEHVIHDPLLLSDMPLAVNRIFQAIEQQERIIVHGDYDADGISSTAILVTVLRDLGGLVAPHLPHRADDGYGLNKRVVTELAGEMDLLIAVDCGITAHAEISALHERGIDTIVIDHHSVPPTLPPAVAIVHPRHPATPYTFFGLCGAGLSWKVAQALLRDSRSPFRDDPDREKWLLDLAILGTVADVVPLQDENRAIVRFGLEVLRRSRRPGLQALLRNTRLSAAALTARDVAFRLVPRLNAAGRMAHAQPALDLLLTQDEAQAELLLNELNQHNQSRQTVTKKVLREAEESITAQDPVIIVYSATWPAGVVGLVASRLSEHYGRPALVIGQAGERMVGSARSPRGTDVLALLEAGRALLAQLGGHQQAAGFTVLPGRLEQFREVVTHAAAQLQRHEIPLILYADTVITPELVQDRVIGIVEKFAPFGEGNKQPAFVIKDLPLLNYYPVGRDQRHVKFIFHGSDSRLEGIGFGLHAQAQQELETGAKVDVISLIEENDYRGRRTLQLNVQDIMPAGKITVMATP